MASRPSSTDDHALQPRDVTGRPSQPTTKLDELIGVEPGREPARHDAQDHPADTIPQGWARATASIVRLAQYLCITIVHGIVAAWNHPARR